SDISEEILVWDLAAGRERAWLQGHESHVISLALAPDGLSLASGGLHDRAIVLWDLATSRPRRRLDVPPGPVAYLAYSPDGHERSAKVGCRQCVPMERTRYGDRWRCDCTAGLGGSRFQAVAGFDPETKGVGGTSPGWLVDRVVCGTSSGHDVSRTDGGG